MENEHEGGCLVSLGQYFAWFVTSILAVVDMLYIREAVTAILAAIQSAKTVAYHAAGGLGLDFSTGFALSLVDDIIIFILGVVTISRGRNNRILFPQRAAERVIAETDWQSVCHRGRNYRRLHHYSCDSLKAVAFRRNKIVVRLRRTTILFRRNALIMASTSYSAPAGYRQNQSAFRGS